MGEPEPRESITPQRRNSRKTRIVYILVGLLIFTGAVLGLMWDGSPLSLSSVSTSLGLKKSEGSGEKHPPGKDYSNGGPSESFLPGELYDLGLYDNRSDFVNEIGISPPYWKPQPHDGSGRTWGPCFPERGKIDWYDERNETEYQYKHDPNDRAWRGPGSLEGLCRPGFLIIGAGKCGTSSLYHYLLGHPRVAPAYSKQIHYFIYGLSKPIDWYYSWFPLASNFLRHGALMTGEASPGYLPYPKAVHAARSLMPGRPKLIAVGRNPLTRMYSSYRYNYKVPTLDAYREGQRKGIKSRMDDEYYEQYLFSFEELVKAELQQLRACLNDFGPKKTHDKWYDSYEWTRAEFDRRKKKKLDPLIDLDLVCYGGRINSTVLREQWAALQMAHPERYIPFKNAFLIQSFIGRSLYVLPLEWWYARFDPEDILFYCTEELSDPGELNNLSMQLGLPSYNYTDVVAQGAFNVGGNRGYDKATAWEEFKEEEQEQEAHSGNQSSSDIGNGFDDGIPLSAETRKEVLEFIQPYNERLFRLVGRRCPW